MAKLYEILRKQCDEVLRSKIKTDHKFSKVETGLDVIGLLEIIEMICMSRDMTNYYPSESVLAERKVQSFQEYNGMSFADYSKEFTMLVNIVETCGAE